MASRPSTSRQIEQTQVQVDEVLNITKTTIDKVLERDQKLSDLGDRATALQNGASQFEQSSRKLKRRYWWQNTKMNIIIGAVVAIILIVILVEIFK